MHAMSHFLKVTCSGVGGRRGLLALASTSLVVLCGSGCTFLGPAAIQGGRAAYNEAIVATNNQQVLSMIVRTRYGETSGLLAVSSVTASLRVGASAGAEFGFGSRTNYRGNLVPLTTGFAYEENPTISYTPVQGGRYMRQLLAPIPLGLTVLMLQELRSSPEGMTLLLRSINGIQNPDFLADPSVTVDARFTRLVELLAQLARQGRASWGQEAGATSSFALALNGEGDGFASQVAELYGLLGLTPPPELGKVITVPLRLGIGRPDETELRFETRSPFDVFHIAAASVDVPDEHVMEGIAPKLPPAGPASGTIRIRRSKRRPSGALTAVQIHGWWYSIDGADAASKLTFRMVESLISELIADNVDHLKATPVLTVPVSR